MILYTEIHFIHIQIQPNRSNQNKIFDSFFQGSDDVNIRYTKMDLWKAFDCLRNWNSKIEPFYAIYAMNKLDYKSEARRHQTNGINNTDG